MDDRAMKNAIRAAIRAMDGKERTEPWPAGLRQLVVDYLERQQGEPRNATIRQVADDLGLHVNNLQRWRNEATAPPPEPAPAARPPPRPASGLTLRQVETVVENLSVDQTADLFRKIGLPTSGLTRGDG